MPPCPTHASAYRQFFTPYPAVAASLRAIAPCHHDEIRQPILPPQSPPSGAHCYTCVSYGPATTTLQIRHLSDTNHFSPATKSVEMCPYLRVDANPSNIPSPQHDEIRQPISPTQDSPVRLIRQLRPRYRHATNATPSRYEKNRFRYGDRRTSYLARDRPPSKFRPIRFALHDETRSYLQTLLVISPLAAKHPRHAPAPSPAQQSEACTTNDIIVHRIPSHTLGWVRVRGTWRANAQH